MSSVYGFLQGAWPFVLWRSRGQAWRCGGGGRQTERRVTRRRPCECLGNVCSSFFRRINSNCSLRENTLGVAFGDNLNELVENRNLPTERTIRMMEQAEGTTDGEHDPLNAAEPRHQRSWGLYPYVFTPLD